MQEPLRRDNGVELAVVSEPPAVGAKRGGGVERGPGTNARVGVSELRST